MALPLAHCALALGITQTRDRLLLGFLALLAILPDFDFILVWGLGLPVRTYHRTFSHSLILSVLLALVWTFIRPKRLQQVSPRLLLAVLLSHSLLDMLCTADSFDHGVMFFWPFDQYRMGWPVLVPLYQVFAPSPFTISGALQFTLLEAVLMVPLWAIARLARAGLLVWSSVLQRRASQWGLQSAD